MVAGLVVDLNVERNGGGSFSMCLSSVEAGWGEVGFGFHFDCGLK